MPIVQAAVGSFTVTSATQFEVTDVTAFGGNTPKGGLLWTGNNTVADTVQDDGYFGLWAFTEDGNAGCLMRYRHNVGTSTVNRVNADGSASFSGDLNIIANN